jgi:glycosyltransferase involved in cell wall biosynthesis
MRKKILIVSLGLSGGGTEKHSVTLANYLSENNFEVYFLAFYHSEPFFSLAHDIIFCEPSFLRKNNNRFIYIYKILWFISKKIVTIKPDRIVSFNEWINPIVLIPALFLRYKVFVAEMMHPDLKIPFYLEFLRVFLYRYATGIIVQTRYGKKIIEEKTKNKNIKVIHNMLNAIEKNTCEKKKIIIAIGRLEKIKGHDYLIKAFSRINDESWTLNLIGSGKEQDNLLKLAETLNISSRVIFSGHKVDFNKDLSEAEIFVLPSVSEGFPNTLIEAMSLPIACISGDYYPGMNDIVVDGENGLLFEPKNVDDLYEKINLLLLDAELRNRLSKNAIKIREKLSPEIIGKKFINFIFKT